MILLPKPQAKGNISLEEVLQKRRSFRKFTKQDVKIEDVSQILWACYGTNSKNKKFKTTPSAGATYPLEIFLVDSRGIYKYDPKRHALHIEREGDFREDLYFAALEQPWIKNAPLNIIICAIFERTTRIYGKRGINYVYIEAGHACQNVLLQATALNLGSVPVGAFYEEEVQKILQCEGWEEPLYIIPIGHIK